MLWFMNSIPKWFKMFLSFSPSCQFKKGDSRAEYSLIGYCHYSKPPRRRYRKWPQESLSVEPRAFEVDTLSSTPQLNAIMDRAMGKVKSMINELEDEKGRIILLKSYFELCKYC